MQPKKIIVGATVLVVMLGGIWWGVAHKKKGSLSPPAKNASQQKSPGDKKSPQSDALVNTTELKAPLDRASERVTKKPFGILIDPKTSPVQPERFHGYHTGTDFEIFPEENNADVSVQAACTGTLEMKRHASGYGGLIVERCKLNDESVAIIYGHLALSSVKASVGDTIEQGSTLGMLGAAGSVDTDRERKHLHFGIYKGLGAINIRGYVTSQKELERWIDACLFVCKK